MTLPDIITRARKRADLSQADLADRLGIHVLTVSRWERGFYNPDPAIFERLADALGIGVEELRTAWWEDQAGHYP